MDSNLRSFRNLTPMESHGIRTIGYSAAGDMVLIAAGNAQVRRLSQCSDVSAPFFTHAYCCLQAGASPTVVCQRAFEFGIAKDIYQQTNKSSRITDQLRNSLRFR